MSRGTPCIACIGVIGRHDNPLHISLFPAAAGETLIPREFEFLLSTCLDIFEARLPSKAASHDFGLLQAINERLAMYGWLTNTGIKFVIVVDMEGKPIGEGEKDRANALLGIRDADLRPAFRAIHAAYVQLLRNPFYDPDEHDPRAPAGQRKVGSLEITSARFKKEMKRIGDEWRPAMTVS